MNSSAMAPIVLLRKSTTHSHLGIKNSIHSCVPLSKFDCQFRLIARDAIYSRTAQIKRNDNHSLFLKIEYTNNNNNKIVNNSCASHNAEQSISRSDIIRSSQFHSSAIVFVVVLCCVVFFSLFIRDSCLCRHKTEQHIIVVYVSNKIAFYC